jgi:hypothetical protein
VPLALFAYFGHAFAAAQTAIALSPAAAAAAFAAISATPQHTQKATVVAHYPTLISADYVFDPLHRFLQHNHTIARCTFPAPPMPAQHDKKPNLASVGYDPPEIGNLLPVFGLRSVLYVACLQISQGARCYAFNLKEDQQARGGGGGGDWRAVAAEVADSPFVTGSPGMG